MQSRESLSRDQQRVGPLVEQFGKSSLQLLEVSRAHGAKQDVRLIGGDLCFPDPLSHTGIG